MIGFVNIPCADESFILSFSRGTPRLQSRSGLASWTAGLLQHGVCSNVIQRQGRFILGLAGVVCSFAVKVDFQCSVNPSTHSTHMLAAVATQLYTHLKARPTSGVASRQGAPACVATQLFISTAAPDAAVLGLLHRIYGKARTQVASPGGPSLCAHVAATCSQLHDLSHQVRKPVSHYIWTCLS